jgi:hypothetical protein
VVYLNEILIITTLLILCGKTVHIDYDCRAVGWTGLRRLPAEKKKHVLMYKHSDSLTLSSFPVAFCVIDGSPGRDRKGKQKLHEIYSLYRDMIIRQN